MEGFSFTVPTPKNEPVREYRPGAPETRALQAKLAELSKTTFDIPLVVNGEEIRTGDTQPIAVPHDRSRRLGHFHKARKEDVQRAIDGALAARREWASWSPAARAAVFLKAAELLAGPFRDVVNAATMLGQSKTVHQAEIDSACELVDFFRFNVAFYADLWKQQPLSAPGQWNRLEYRPLEGFVFAVTPFNFTSIAGNLPTAPALLGNTCLWKPASTSILSNYFVMKLLDAAGFPPGVVQFLPGSGALIGSVALASEHLAGIHFTGSTGTFNGMWKTVGENVGRYRSYPRLVGETGGKDFVFAHPSADPDVLRVALVRGAFEYQGQKCSAASRAYVPRSLWKGAFRDALIAETESLPMGDIADFRNFMGAVIDQASFENLRGHIARAREGTATKVVAGGGCRDEVGWFVEPTIIETTDPRSTTMCEELFGPVLTIYVYDDAKWEEMLEVVDKTSPYALTGAFLARDRGAIERADRALVQSAGNYYVNNKPTGAVVGQQPFGGGRASGTNDKAGSVFNLIRWASLRTVSETFVPPTDYRYPFMER
jgi:1-pyrroline-5-carboxylate dehydrogenase